MNIADFTGYIFIGSVAFLAYRWITPRYKVAAESIAAKMPNRITEAETFLETLTACQVVTVKDWVQRGGLASSVSLVIGLENFYYLSLDNGIAETIRHTPSICDKVASRKLAPPGNNT